MAKNKMRVYQAAKELGIKSAKMLSILADLGVPIKGNLSSIDTDTVSLVKEYIQEIHKRQEEEEKKGKKKKKKKDKKKKSQE